MKVRTYDSTDREAVIDLDTATPLTTYADVEFHNGSFTWQEMTLAFPTVKRHDLAQHLAEDPPGWDCAYLATHNDRVCGFAACTLSSWNRRLCLLHMYVDSQMRGQGIGRALLNTLFNAPESADAQHVWLETQVDNVPAIRAYESMGFRIVGLDQTLYGDRPGNDTALYMSRRLR